VRGVWGEVYFAVQMSAKGDCVTLLEPDAEKQASSSFLFEEHVLYMSLNRHRHLPVPGVGKQVPYSVYPMWIQKTITFLSIVSA